MEEGFSVIATPREFNSFNPFRMHYPVGLLGNVKHFDVCTAVSHKIAANGHVVFFLDPK